jgi:hypothetical protein
MSLGTILDVAIGLVFTYLLLAILVSGVQEATAGWLSRRGKSLKLAVQALLSGTTPTGTPDMKLFNTVFGHGLIEDTSRKRLPSYIPARNFALSLMEALKDGTQAPLFTQVERSVAVLPAGTAKECLTTMVTHASGDLDALRGLIETWFNDGMDRLTGEYKRRSQVYLLAIGLLISVCLNIDSIVLVRTLSNDQVVSAAMADAADKYAKSNPDMNPADKVAAAQDALKALNTLPVPIGWRDTVKPGGQARNAWQLFLATFAPKGDGWAGEGIWNLIGWLLSGIAASLGAPYWFALLQQALGLRNAGPKPPSPPPTPTRAGQ